MSRKGEKKWGESNTVAKTSGRKDEGRREERENQVRER